MKCSIKSTVAMMVIAALPGAALAAQQGSLSGSTYTITVAEGQTITLNGDDVAALGLDRTLVKMGRGTLIIDCDLGSTYDGEIIVRQGFLRPTCGDSAGSHRGLGGITKGTTVEAGATLEMVGASGENECGAKEPITFAGAGVDGCGAIYHYSGCNIGYGLFVSSPITMTGDATVGSKTSGRWFRIRNTAIDMNGHTLTFQNDNTGNGFKGGNGASGPVANPGNIVVESGATFCFENAYSYIPNGSSANRFIMKANSTLRQAVAVMGRCGWTLQVDGAAKITQDSGVTSGAFGWEGPIVLNDTLTIESTSASHQLVFNGAVSGTGSLVYSGAGKTQMNGDATRVNTYTGGTSFGADCDVTIAAPGLIPSTAGAITAAARAKVLIQPQAAGDNAFFTDASVSTLSRVMTAGADRGAEVFIAGLDSSWPAYFADAAALSGTEEAPTMYSGFLTNSETRITGAMSGFVNLAVRPKTSMRISSDGATEGWVEVNGGTLVIPVGTTLTVSNRVFVGGADASHIGRLKVEGMLDFNHENAGWRGVLASSQALKGKVRTTEHGIVEIAPGAVVNGYLGLNQGGCVDGVSQSLNGQGSYLLKGTVNATAEAFIGDFRSEYLEVADGGVLNTMAIRTGRGSGSYANLRVMQGGSILGGLANNTDVNLAYNGGQTDLLVDGGRISVPNSGFTLNNAEGSQAGAYTALTVCDGGEVRFPTPNTGSGWASASINRSNNSTGYINLLDGGLLEGNSIKRAADRTNNRGIVSFDGGIYAMRYNSNSAYQNQNCFHDFQAGEGTAGDHVFVFSKGATISNDTPTYVGFTMEAPTGKGIEAITLPSEIANMAAWQIPGPPMVRITDPTGYGATAIALYDSANGRISAVKVTSRGVNYTNPTVTFSKGGLAAAKAYTGCCTLTDNVSGGLAKTGTGTLTVTNTMAYTGPTTVCQGTLKLGLDNALDSSSGIVVESGATLDLNGKACTVPVSGFGNVNGGITLPAEWTLDAVALNAATTSLTATGNVMIPVGTTVTIENADQLDISKKYVLTATEGSLVGFCPALVCENPRPWALTKTNNRLVLAFVRGMVVNFR